MVIATAVAGISIIGFWNGLVVKNYTVKSNKVIGTIKIVLITDLHSHIYGENQEHIAGKIKKEAPDLILLAGDIVDDVAPIVGAEQFFAAIEGMAPIYYVMGNHEFWVNDVEHMKKMIRSYGVNVLENNYEKITINGSSLVIGGVDDPARSRAEIVEGIWESDIQSTFDELKTEDSYKILLSHRPEKTDLYAKLPFDMIVSGHAHGGQVRIPFILNGLIAPNQGFFPKHAGGLYEYSGKTHIVSRGVSFNRKLPRVFNPPEVVSITLKH